MISINFNEYYPEEDSEKWVIYAITILSSVLFVRDIAGVGINQIVILAIMAIPLLLFKYNQLLYYTCFICAIPKGVNAYILTLLFIALCLKSPEKKTIQFLPAIILLLLELVDSIGLIEWGQYILYASYLFLFFYLLFEDSLEVDASKCLMYFSLGLSLLLVIISISVLRNPLDMIFYQEGEVRASMGVEDVSITTHFVLNANELAYYSITLLAITLVGKQKLKIPTYLYLFFLIVAIVSGVLSQSRTWILVASLMTAVFILLNDLKTKLSFMVAALLFCIAGLSMYSDIIDTVIDGIIFRFDNTNLDTAGNRTVLFEEYNNFFSSNPEYWLAGTGAIYYKDVAQCSNSMHNAIQQIYICYGILGSILFLCTSVMFYRIIKDNNFPFRDYIPLIVVLFFIQSIQFLNPPHLMLPIALMAYSLKIPSRENVII